MPREPYAVPLTETFELASRETGNRYQISVGLPFSYAQTDGDRDYPVVYVLDANMIFGTAAETARALAMTGEIAETIVVGIGYPGFDFDEYNKRRAYDFLLPGEWDLSGPRGARLEALFDEIDWLPEAGGAPGFLGFITSEVKPEIEASYRVDTNDQGLYGHSAGGAFAIYTLLTDTRAFGKYICASTGFSLAGSTVMQLEEEYAQKNDSLPAKLMLSAGLAELDNDGMAAISIVGNTTRMYELLRLRQYKGLELSYYLSPDIDHTSACVELLTRGLRKMWPATN